MGFRKKQFMFAGVALGALVSLTLTATYLFAQGASEVPPYSDNDLYEELQSADQTMSGNVGRSTSGGHTIAGVRRTNKTYSRAEAFLASPDWEFDGFVSGGQDSEIKSMFITNDLLYLNIGALQGLQPGDDLDVFRRGGKVQDPQNGEFIGYEVRRAAVARVTDRVNEKTSVARIVRTYEGVEIGDLVRRQ